MYRIEQVLVPVDLSSFSRCALEFARQLGDDDGDRGPIRLQMAHAVEALPGYVRSVLFPYAPLGEDDRQFEAEIAETARGKLAEYFEFGDELRERFVDAPLIEFGSDKQWVGRWAGKYDVDLIAMGAFGRHGVFSAGVGSTARRAVAAATRPVALMRDYDPTPRIGRIVAAVDLERQSEWVVEVAAALALEFDAELECLYAIPSPFCGDGSRVLQRHLDTDEQKLKDELSPRVDEVFEELFDRLEVPFRHREAFDRLSCGHRIGVGDPADEIGRYVSEEDADLVVLGTGGDSDGRKPGRVASAVMAEVPTHQVLVPPKRDATPLERWGGRA